jgi:hypothetical protein
MTVADPFLSKLNRTETDVLVIHCGDYRFQSAFHDFLTHLNLGTYDLIVIPGGPLSLTLGEHLSKYRTAVRPWLHFFVELHKLTRLILIQHQDCGFYKSMPAHLFASAGLRECQEQDLRRVREIIAAELPHLAVDLYYAGWDASDNVAFELIPSLPPRLSAAPLDPDASIV